MRRLSSYIAGALRKPLPAQVAERAKCHSLDTLAAMVSGSRLLPGRKAIAFAESQGGMKEACVAGTRLVTSAVNAALANGMLGHADETDDAHFISLTHPGCGVVPAALAMAERERRNGTALLRAVVLGYDICARTTLALRPEPFRIAGHSTHSFGATFGAAAAAGALAGLNASQVRILLSYAAQQASGLSCWARDTEHIEKAFDFGGMPGRNGIMAALMAAHGLSGVEDVFSGERNYFFAYGRDAAPETMADALGSVYEIMNTSIKRWPVGYPIQAPLDALSTLLGRERVRAAEIDKITITIGDNGAQTVSNREMASINIQHLIALMLIDGDITFASAHDEKRVGDAGVLALRQRVEIVGSAEMAKTHGQQAIVEIATRDGRKLRHHTLALRGSPANPLPRAEVEAKCLDLLAPVLGKRRARELIDTVWNVERVSDARRFRALLRA